MIEIVDSICGRGPRTLVGGESYTFFCKYSNGEHSWIVDLLSLSSHPEQSGNSPLVKFFRYNGYNAEVCQVNEIRLVYRSARDQSPYPVIIEMTDEKDSWLRIDGRFFSRRRLRKYSGKLLEVFQIASGGQRQFNQRYRASAGRLSNVDFDNIVGTLGEIVGSYATVLNGPLVKGLDSEPCPIVPSLFHGH